LIHGRVHPHPKTLSGEKEMRVLESLETGTVRGSVLSP
jgi:hypothetical protein